MNGALLQTATQNSERSSDSANRLGQQFMQIVNARGDLAVISQNDITFAQACPLSRALGLNRYHEYACFRGQVVEADNPSRKWNILSGHTYVPSPDFPVADQAA